MKVWLSTLTALYLLWPAFLMVHTLGVQGCAMLAIAATVIYWTSRPMIMLLEPCSHWIAILLVCNPATTMVCGPTLQTLPLCWVVTLFLCSVLSMLILSMIAILYSGPAQDQTTSGYGRATEAVAAPPIGPQGWLQSPHGPPGTRRTPAARPHTLTV